MHLRKIFYLNCIKKYCAKENSNAATVYVLEELKNINVLKKICILNIRTGYARNFFYEILFLRNN